jgi:hypothetical protein
MGKLLLAVLIVNGIVATGGGGLERHRGRFGVNAVRPLSKMVLLWGIAAVLVVGLWC